MELFLTATIVMVYTACVLGQNFLDLILKISLESICGYTYRPGTILIEHLIEKRDTGVIISMDLIREAISRQINGLKLPDFMLKSPTSWPEDMAPYVWDWIHTVTIHVDLNGGRIEKENFIHLVEHVILCATCRQHFIHNVTNITDAIQNKTSLTMVFLALHTHITRNKDGGGPDFIYNNSDVLEKYKKLYFQKYITLITK